MCRRQFGALQQDSSEPDDIAHLDSVILIAHLISLSQSCQGLMPTRGHCCVRMSLCVCFRVHLNVSVHVMCVRVRYLAHGLKVRRRERACGASTRTCNRTGVTARVLEVVLEKVPADASMCSMCVLDSRPGACLCGCKGNKHSSMRV